MEPKLKIKTKLVKKDDEYCEDEPVSPTGQFLNSKVLSLTILVVFESEDPVHDSFPVKDMLQDILLPLNPRFSSIMVTDKNGVQHWKRVEVNLEDHIYYPTFPLGLSLQEYDNHFNEYLTKLTTLQLSQDRPLWEVHIAKYPTTKALGHCIFKIHHAIGDGYSLMGLLLSCLRRADNPLMPLSFPSLRASSSGDSSSSSSSNSSGRSNRASVFSMVYNTICDFGFSVFKSLVGDDETPIRSGIGCVHGANISTTSFSLDCIKQIKSKMGMTVNDVIAGVVFLGTRMYMQEISPTSRDSNTTALILLNTRDITTYMSKEEMLLGGGSHNPKWGNQYAFLHLPLPTLPVDQLVNPVDFLIKTHEMLTRKKNSRGVFLVGRALQLLTRFRGHEAGAKYVYNTLNKASMGLTNMIGPIQKMALANHRCKGVYFAVLGTPKSVSVSIMSYADTLRIAVVGEKDFIDTQKSISCIHNAYELIYNAAV